MAHASTSSTHDPIVAPAVRVQGEVHAAPRPADDDVDGIHSMSHGDAIWHAVRSGKASHDVASRALLDPTAMGFVTRSGKYMTRREAASQVLATNQFRIKNPKDSQLVKLKERLQRQLDQGHPETSLDSYDVDYFAKSQASFEEIEHTKSDGVRSLVLRVMHPNGQQGMDVHMMRGDGHPKGWWDIANVDPVDKTHTIEGHTHSNAFANRLGPAVIRQTVKHLKENYGVTKLRGHRVTGARFAGQPDDKDSIEQRDLKYTEQQIEKAFQALYARLEKGRVTPLFRVTTTPPNAEGKGPVRANPMRGVTYFANTQQGAADGGLISGSERDQMHMYHTAVTPDHRIYGHRLPRIISEERIAARKQHVDRLVSAAPHPVIGHMMRNLESRLWERSHTKITLPNGKPGRQYYHRGESIPFSGKHAPLTWKELEGDHDLEHKPSEPTLNELRAAGPYHPRHLGGHKSIVQAALHRLGYHGTAVDDEGGSWRGTRSSMSGKDEGSIALLPHAIGGKKLSVVKEPDIPEFERRREERRRALTKAEVENSFKRRSRGDALQPWRIVKRKPKHPLFDNIMIVRIPRGAERDQYNAPTSTPGYAEAMADAAGDSGNV